MRRFHGFTSDNSATVHPAVLAAISRVNEGHASGYGHDDYSRAVAARVAERFGPDAQAFFVWGGSAANVVSIRAALRPWQAVLCTDTAHINVDECGAVEAIAGAKLLRTAGEDGKLSPALLSSLIARLGDEHAVQPGLVSLTQCTELGTVYTLEETRELCGLAHEHGLLVHVDGARLANAAAALGASLRELTTDAGVDIVSFGGTKNGAMGVEAVVILDPRLADGFEYLRKQTLQLASKMRFIAAQFDALLDGDLWLANARAANAMAARLAGGVRDIPGLEITRPVQTNAVFASLSDSARARLHERFMFLDWDESFGEVRWMCSWDTTEEDVDAFAAAVREELALDGLQSPR